jgi:hypothetical protein
LQRKKKLSITEEIFLMVAGSAVQKFELTDAQQLLMACCTDMLMGFT